MAEDPGLAARTTAGGDSPSRPSGHVSSAHNPPGGPQLLPPLVDRDDYPTLREAVYLNQAALGLIGRPAVEAMHDLLDRVARHGNLHLSDEEEVAFLDDLRERAARLLQVDGAQLAILSSASELLGQAPFLLAPPRGSKVILVASDFPAITRPWLRLAAQGECRLEFVEDRPDSDLATGLVDRIDGRTSVMAVGWVQYATGTVVDIPRLRAATEEAGVRLVVDATQGAGALPCDADAWRADLVVSSGYKWLGGHGGVAIGVLDPGLITQVPPLPGWMGAPDPFAFDARQMQLADDARRFTQSTMSYVSVVGLTTALDRLLTTGLDRIERHARALRDLLFDAVEGGGWRAFRDRGDPAAAPHIVPLARPGAASVALTARLRKHGIVCGSRAGRLRISLAPYNGEGDVAALAAVLAQGDPSC